ncbi:hypothetical protein LY76DRAFT_429900 [Colletotrichum caudatum]|nr:hypothetical protein LY76DRAFT_429900 [Colletotrichum caudatum]
MLEHRPTRIWRGFGNRMFGPPIHLKLRPIHHSITQFRSPVTTATPLHQRHSDNSNNNSFFFCASRHNSFAGVSTIFPFERVFYSTTTSTAPKLFFFFFFIRYSDLSPPPSSPVFHSKNIFSSITFSQHPLSASVGRPFRLLPTGASRHCKSPATSYLDTTVL